LKLIEQNHGRIVGIVEVGLDYHWESDLRKRDQQKVIFRKFIAAAEKYKLPLVIHSWDAEPDCYTMVRDSKVKCVFHCFSGDPELAKQIADRGFFISLSTNVCSSKKLRSIARAVPLESMLLETDSPFLDPER
jgi:TatD DNase family protein